MNEERILVITPEAIGFATPEINAASELLAARLWELVNFAETLYPGLERHESILVAGSLLQGIPVLINDNPEMLEGIKQLIQEFKNSK